MIHLPNINTADQERVMAFLLRFFMCGPGYEDGWTQGPTQATAHGKLTPLCTGIITGVKHQGTYCSHGDQKV